MKVKMPRIFLLSVLSPLFIAVAASASPLIVLQPSSEQVVLGGEFTLWVNVQEVDSLFAASFELEYDASLLEVTDASAGDFMGKDVIFFDIKGDNSVSIAVTMKAGANPVIGSGTIAKITFISKAEGTSQISYRQETLDLRRADGTLIPVTVEDGAITVIDAGVASLVLSIAPSSKQVSIGDQFPIQIRIDNATGLFAASLELQFDKTMLKAVSAIPDDFLGGDVIHMAVPGDGSISVGISKKAGAAGVDGSGVIALVVLEAIGDGNTDVSFNTETITLKGLDDSPIDGSDSLEVSSAHISIRKLSLVADGKLVKTWGDVKTWP